jgi:hypothetical protein
MFVIITVVVIVFVRDEGIKTHDCGLSMIVSVIMVVPVIRILIVIMARIV